MGETHLHGYGSDGLLDLETMLIERSIYRVITSTHAHSLFFALN